MKNRTKLYIVLGMMGIVFMGIGLVTGYMIGSLKGRDTQASEVSDEPVETAAKKEAATVNRPQVIVSDDNKPKVTNVYIPARERILGQIPVNSYNTGNFYIEDGFMAYHDAFLLARCACCVKDICHIGWNLTGTDFLLNGIEFHVGTIGLHWNNGFPCQMAGKI